MNSINPCTEIICNLGSDSFVDTMDNFMKQRKENQKKREALVEHLIDHGWATNYKYIEDQKRKNGEIKKKEVDVDFNALVMGKYKGDYHLITKCEKYTVRIKEYTATFWKKDDWVNLGEFPIKDIKLTDRGVKYEIINIETQFIE